MAMGTTVPKSIDEYIAACPPAVRPTLTKIRSAIRAAAPAAKEVISYRMPAFKGHGILLYFAAFKAHIGIFPPVSGDPALAKAIARYAGPKGNLKFPLDQPFPYPLLKRIVLQRVKRDRLKNTPTTDPGSPPTRSRRGRGSKPKPNVA